MERLITKNLTNLYLLSHSCLAGTTGSTKQASSLLRVEWDWEHLSFFIQSASVALMCVGSSMCVEWCQNLQRQTVLAFFSYRNLLIIVPHTALLLNMFFFLRQKYSFASNPQVSKVTDDNIMRHPLIRAVLHCSQDISPGWPIVMHNKCNYNSCVFQLNYKL